MPINPPQIGASYIAGRQARQQSDYAGTRNALAEMELQNAPTEMANRNRLLSAQTQGAEQSLGAEKAKFAYTTLKQALDSGNPKAFVLQNVPDLASNLSQRGIDLQSMDDQSASQMIDSLARKYAGEAGIAPAAPEAVTISEGQTRFVDGKPAMSVPKTNAITPYQQQRLDIERQKLSQPKPADTGPLVQVAGPDGNPVYRTREQAVDQPAYVARDKPAAADLKYQREIKSKQPRLAAAIRRVDRLAEAAAQVAKIPVFNGGPIDQYAIGWTKAAQELKQAAASLTPELTALTRVPGIGSQSDLETRLAGLQFPSTEFAPEINAKAVAELKAFMSDLKDVYGMVGQEVGAASAEQPAQTQAPQQAIEYLKANPQFKGAFKQKYGYLP